MSEDMGHPVSLQTPQTLGELVEAFFRSQEPKERASLIRSIAKAANGSIEVVGEAVQNARLWSALPDGPGTFRFQSGTGGTVEVAYRLPAAYDPARRFPVIVCMPVGVAGAPSLRSKGGGPTHAGRMRPPPSRSRLGRVQPSERMGHLPPADTFTLAGEALGESVRAFVLIAPMQPVGGTFHQPAAGASDLRRLMRQARRRIHIDTDRVFLFGFGAGGNAAWIEAIAHADLFAGVMTLSGYPRVPYPAQVYPFLLENLRKLPVLTVWSTPTVPPRRGDRRGVADDPQATTRQNSVAHHNRAIVEFAKQASLPIVGVARSNLLGRAVARLPTAKLPLDRATRPGGLIPPPDEVSRILGRRRAPPADSVSHWFRYPGQGHAGWLRQTRFMGDAWEAEQLSILTSATTDRDRFIAEVVKDKLAYLGGWIEGQTITIETRRCARIDLLLPDGLVDFNRPVTIRCNGKRRHNGLVRRSIRTLLETAHEQWEFQRLTVARLSFSIKSDAASN